MIEQEIKYILESEKYTMKDQKSLDNLEENFETIDSVNVYLKYEEDFFEKLFDIILKSNKIEGEEWEQIKSNAISFLFSILSIKYKKYLKKFDNTISDIFITLRENKEDEEYQSDILFIFKNKYIEDPLYIVFENIPILKVNDQEKKENLIKSFEDLNEKEEKITGYIFNPEPIVDWMDNNVFVEQDKNAIEKYLDYYNLYIVNDNKKTYTQLDDKIIKLPEYHAVSLVDLIDIIFLCEENIFNPQTNTSIYGVYDFETLEENDWGMDIVKIFKEDISKLFQK